MSEFKDWLGQEIFKGALVLYVTSYGSSSVETRLGRVQEVKEGEAMVEWIRSNKYSLPGAKATKVNIKGLTVAPEEWTLL